ncbi:ABC transporter permease subunit [Marisediminicola sp. LYQ134]|uniref:ABC transporter permease subunit n=1 Tax=Marisediminicola sp. LYQ134 TaxID=3391061 RepID=UPI003982F5A9
MSATVLRRSSHIPTPAPARLRLLHIVRSEFIKLASLRSIVLSLATIVVTGLGISLALALTMESAGVPSQPSAEFLLWTVTFGAYMLGQLVAALLGVLAVSGEYSAGTIQPALLSVPSRLPVLAAKALAVFTVSTGAGLVATVGSWAVTYPLFDELGLAVGLGEPGVALALAGTAVYLGLVSVFALGVATAVRSAAGGITIVVMVLLILPVAVGMLGGAVQWVSDATPYLLSNAGESMTFIADTAATSDPDWSGPLSPSLGALVVLAWSAISLAIGAALLRGRDV